MAEAELILEGKSYKLSTIVGTEGEKAIDISKLRDMTGYITMDPGYQNTGSCMSAITYIDGEKGILRYRGIPVEELAEKSSFVETAYLLIYGKLPTREEKNKFSERLNIHSMLHEDMIHFFDRLPPYAHPMAILSSVINALSIFYPEFYTETYSKEIFDNMTARLISKIRTIAAFSYKKSIGEPYVYPRYEFKYCANFLNMMFSSPVKPYTVDPDVEKLMNILLILHADHEQNCSTSTVRLVGSSRVNLYSSICAGICALWGPLHGGANQEVIETLEEIRDKKLKIKDVIEDVKAKKFRLSGFGHRIYKNYDPRAKILKEQCQKVMPKLNKNDPLLDIALEIEEIALKDEYFIERKLYPNVDFYSGILYRAIGIPTNMFTVMFAMGRMPGWIAQWKEMYDSVPFKIGRPRQIYIGNNLSHYIPIEERK
ncbi:MAG TPA: citrate synthase [Spirochaetota bacterium]|nr:citrate synthase [Spirochaetota bacterium]HOL56985.1 citrate synthase [Spirochaetota bacterium]HPP05150.1 citrate synthase [Spirochaetota bacterium]